MHAAGGSPPDSPRPTSGPDRWGEETYAIFNQWAKSRNDVAARLGSLPRGLVADDVLVLLWLGEYASSQSANVPVGKLPSQASLKERSGRGQKAISDRLGKLTRAGFVERIPKQDAPPVGVQLYRLTADGRDVLDQVLGVISPADS